MDAETQKHGDALDCSMRVNVWIRRRNRSTSTSLRRTTVFVLAACCVLLRSPPVAAGTAFGIYDARTLAMGGASVSSSNNDNAQFYNPALLAFNEEIEENTKDSRFLFPLLIPQVAESVLTIEKISRDDTAQAISNSVSDYNAMPDALTAQSVADVSANLDADLADIDGANVFADIYIGLAISEPSKFRGAGFFLGTRIVAGGQPAITPADRELLAAYQEAMTFVATNGAQGVARPELFDANGALIDPRGDFDSTVSAAGAVITEAGVAMSRQMNLFGQPIAGGLSFKVQRVDTFEDVQRVVDNRPDVQQNNQQKSNINIDVGLVRAIGERWRIGLAVKDIIPYSYDTSLDTSIRLRPRARIGTTYQTGRLQLTADADLTRNEPLGGEQPTQEFAIGTEWALGGPAKLRAGLRNDLQGNRDSVLSVGAGTIWKRLAIDLAYAAGSDARAAALQFGLVF